MDKLAYSVKEAAEALGISIWLMKEEIYSGRIYHTKVGTRVLIPRWALEKRLSPEPAAVQANGAGH